MRYCFEHVLLLGLSMLWHPSSLCMCSLYLNSSLDKLGLADGLKHTLYGLSVCEKWEVWNMSICPFTTTEQQRAFYSFMWWMRGQRDSGNKAINQNNIAICIMHNGMRRCMLHACSTRPLSYLVLNALWSQWVNETIQDNKNVSVVTVECVQSPS